MPYSNPITKAELTDLAANNPLHPRDGSPNEMYMPPAYFLVPPATTNGPVKWRLFDAAYIQTGIIDPNRLGTGATGAGNLYLADDGQWKTISGGGGGGDMLKATYDTDNSGIVDKAEALMTLGRNSTGATLYKGTVIRIQGSTGHLPNFVKAQGNNDANSAQTFGIIATDIANNSDGYAIVQGTIDTLDTRSVATHPFTDVTLVDGDILYLHPTIPGYLTNVKPLAPQHLVYVGVVTRTSPTNGTIVYRIQNGYELDEIHDVAIASKANNDLLVYESASNLWKNKTFSAIFGGTPLVSVPTLDQVTTAGNTTTNAITVGKLNVINTSTTIAPVVISGTNPFSGGAGVDYLVINGTGNVGTTLKTDVGGYVAHRFYGNNVELGVFYVGETNKEFVFKNSTTGYIDFQTTSSSTSRLRIFNNGNLAINTTTDAGYKLDVNGTTRFIGVSLIRESSATSVGLDFTPGNLPSIKFTGNTGSTFLSGRGKGIGVFNVATDPTAKFQVGGIYAASSAISRGLFVNTELQAAANNDVLVGLDINPTFTNGAFTGVTNIALRTQTGNVIFGSTSGNVLINTTTDAGYKLDVNGTARIQGNTTLLGTLTMGNGSFSYSANPNFWFSIAGNQGLILNHGNGNNGGIILGDSTSPNFTVAYSNTTKYGVSISRPVTAITGSTNLTFNSLVIDNVINYTNAVTSIARGIHINPTLTSVTDFRAIEVGIGTIVLGRMTSDPSTAINGMIYYNTTINKFRGYENGSWQNLI
jgi:hypothetical protein